MTLYINNQKVAGRGPALVSLNPFDGTVVWRGYEANLDQINQAVEIAKKAALSWRLTSFETRLAYVERFGQILTKQQEKLAQVIATETGKPLWESRLEVNAMINKIHLSHRAYLERTGETLKPMDQGQARLIHRPIGVLAVYGPFNFPAHLPNGHIIPALLAGNTVVFKPSEYTPYTGEMMMDLWMEVGLPSGVLQCIQGGRNVGEMLAKTNLDGLLFTGSAVTGHALHHQFSGQPDKMLALEMGGNNPLIVSSDHGDLDACVYTIIQSAFISAGQRCTCARRLFLPQGEKGDLVLKRLCAMTQGMRLGSAFDEDPPYMGTLISAQAAKAMLDTQALLLSLGAKTLVTGRHIAHGRVTPAILDVTAIVDLPDEEYFAPLLQVIRYSSFAEAIIQANATRFGLSAGLISTQEDEWHSFYQQSSAGIINRNRPLTGASSDVPFGGTGASGNFRPSAYYAADYCAYPVASIESDAPSLPSSLTPGLSWR